MCCHLERQSYLCLQSAHLCNLRECNSELINNNQVDLATKETSRVFLGSEPWNDVRLWTPLALAGSCAVLGPWHNGHRELNRRSWLCGALFVPLGLWSGRSSFLEQKLGGFFSRKFFQGIFVSRVNGSHCSVIFFLIIFCSLDYIYSHRGSKINCCCRSTFKNLSVVGFSPSTFAS